MNTDQNEGADTRSSPAVAGAMPDLDNRKRTGKYIARWVPEGEHKGEVLGSVFTLDAAMRRCWNHAYNQLNGPT